MDTTKAPDLCPFCLFVDPPVQSFHGNKEDRIIFLCQECNAIFGGTTEKIYRDGLDNVGLFVNDGFYLDNDRNLCSCCISDDPPVRSFYGNVPDMEIRLCPRCGRLPD